MSYILDALKKSEQERGNGAIPGVQTIHSSSLNYHQEKRPVWPWLLVTLIIINLVAIIYFAQSTSTKTEITTAEVNVTRENISPINTQLESITTTSKNAFSTPDTVAAAQPPQPIQAEATIPQSQTTQQLEDITPSPRTVDLYDLPLSVRQYIPAMEFSAHVYSSNPLQRSLVINSRFMEEGSQVSDDLILTEITSDGAIFEFQSYRFSTSVLSGWN